MEIITKHGITLMIDKTDFHLIEDKTLYLSGKGSNQYLQVRHENKTKSLHRVIMGAEKGQIVDHINRNTFDNRRSNLRFVTHSQNCINAKVPKRNKYSNYKGVTFHKRDKRWVAICNKKHIGNFNTEIEAARAYDTFIVSEYGKYALTNFGQKKGV